VVDLAGDEALEAADDLAFAEASGGAAMHVVAGGLVAAHPKDSGDVDGAAGGPVAAAAEPVAAGGQAPTGGLGQASCGQPCRASARCTVDGFNPSPQPIRAGAQPL
jgi:hypothetical protein